MSAVLIAIDVTGCILYSQWQCSECCSNAIDKLVTIQFWLCTFIEIVFQIVNIPEVA